MSGVSAGPELEKLDHLMHCANNCRQMLRAIDRKLKQALQCMENGQTADCREMLTAVSEALPEAIAIIEHRDEQSTSQGQEGEEGQ